MAIQSYRCSACKFEFEIMGEQPTKVLCPACDSTMYRLIPLSNFRFKGKGWGGK